MAIVFAQAMVALSTPPSRFSAEGTGFRVPKLAVLKATTALPQMLVQLCLISRV
ncbi:hypothetical protein CHS0354_001422, partial [Potamilus streckersoni]